MLNRIIVIGRLTRDPEMKYTPQGVPVATMGIAVNRFTKDENGNNEVDFFDVVAWRRSAEFASNYLTKGRLVSVDGRLQTRSYVAQDGTKRKVYEIVAENLEGLDRKGDTDGAPAHSAGDGAGMETERAVAAAPTPAPRPAAAVGAGASGGSRKPAPPPVDDDLDESDPFADE
jgi:single-strand DNA-binding protein